MSKNISVSTNELRRVLSVYFYALPYNLNYLYHKFGANTNFDCYYFKY